MEKARKLCTTDMHSLAARNEEMKFINFSIFFFEKNRRKKLLHKFLRQAALPAVVKVRGYFYGVIKRLKYQIHKNLGGL